MAAFGEASVGVLVAASGRQRSYSRTAAIDPLETLRSLESRHSELKKQTLNLPQQEDPTSCNQLG